MKAQDEYRLFLEHINKLTDRRQTVTTIYLSVNTAIIAAMTFLFREIQAPGWAQQASALVLVLSGFVACDLWRRLITQYSALLDWWYEQLRGLEAAMEEGWDLITKEYEELYVRKKGRVNIGLTRYVVRLTWLFTVLYILFGSLFVAAILGLI